MKNKVFSGIAELPNGTASDKITDGCIVLEGGGFRGVYTSGVLDALMEADINMNCTIGVSAGALNGVNYVSGQIGRSGRTNLRYRHDSRYVGSKAIRSSKGIIGFSFLFNELEELDPIDKNRLLTPDRRFIAVATNCLTGKPEYFESKEIKSVFQEIRASSSLPFASQMVYINGVPYLDGGCSNKIPYNWAIENGFDKIIVVKTRPDEYRKKISENSNHTFTKLRYHSFPQFAEALSKSDENYNKQCDEIDTLRKQGRLYVISPSQPVTVGRLESDMEKLGELYYMGYNDAQRQIDNIRKYLSAESRY